MTPALAIAFQRLEGLVEGSAKFGTLEMTPIILMLGYQSLPVQQKGVAFHASIGGGIASSEFEEGKFIKDLEASSGENIDISQDDAFMFELGAGLDYFFTKNIALLLDFRWLIGTIDSDWDFGAGGTENYTFNVSNIQLVGGVRLWF